jgi:hypothetical protein
MDNDCNGIVDDEPGADRWCWLVDGPGHLCQGGQCVCPGTCGGMTGSDAGGGDDAVAVVVHAVADLERSRA